MFTVVLLVVVLGGAAVAFFVFRNAAGANAVAISARLGRYGIVNDPGGASQLVAPTHLRHEQHAVTQSVDRLIGGSSYAAKVAVKLERANLNMMPSEYIMIWFAIFVVAAAVGLLFKGMIGLLVLGVLGGYGPWYFLGFRAKRRRKAFIGQLADTAQMMGNSMRSGFSIIQSMELVGQEAPSPVREEFERVVTEVKLGLPIDTALDHLLQRISSEDLELMVVAINVQRQIGGNLAEILQVISQTIRERVRFERELRTLTAQARYSSYIITALPVGVAIAINFMDRSYESFLYTQSLGYLMIGIAVSMVSIGFFILRKLAEIEV
jgi:tight adherence protein B